MLHVLWLLRLFNKFMHILLTFISGFEIIYGDRDKIPVISLITVGDNGILCGAGLLRGISHNGLK